MENQEITRKRTGVSDIGSHLDHDIEFVDPIQVEEDEEFFERKNSFLDESSHDIKVARGKNRRVKVFNILLNIKKAYPDVDLRKFLELYVKDKNINSFEDKDNLELADKAEDYFFKKLRRKIKKAGRKLKKWGKKTVKKVGKKLGNVVKFIAGYSLLLPLRPFKPMMRKALARKGKKTSKRTSLVDVATRFYKYVIRGTHFEELPDDWYYSDPMFQQGTALEDFSEDHIAGSAIKTIVVAIIKFIKKNKKKIEKGIEFTGLDGVLEKEVGYDATQVQKNLEEKQAEELIEEHGKLEAKAGLLTGKTTTYLLIGLIGLLLLKKL